MNPELSSSQSNTPLAELITLASDDRVRAMLVGTVDKLMQERKEGLEYLSSDENTNDNNVAFTMRKLFKDEIVIPILHPNAIKSAHMPEENDPNYPYFQEHYHGSTGYVVGIDQFLDVYCSFRHCEGVQICFGLDKPLADGGQLQLVFRGYGGYQDGNENGIYITPRRDGPTDTVKVRPCPPTTGC